MEQVTPMQIMVARFGLTPNERGASLSTPSANFYTGHTCADHLDFYERVLVRCPRFEPKDEWSNGYRYVFINRDEMAIFTYCEGDLDLTVDSDLGTFEARLDGAAKFYAQAA